MIVSFYLWLCLLLIDTSIGCVGHFFLDVSFAFSFFLSNIVFGLIIMGF